MADDGPGGQPIIIKKIKKYAGGHHGGAWKVAYADFVTAMMAFFLLLWLLNVTTKEQKAGIADYFDPVPKISTSDDGAGGLMGGLSISPDGAMVTTVQPPVAQEADPTLRAGADPKAIEEEKLKEEVREREEARFKKAEEAIQDAIESSPDLKNLSKNIMMDMTPEGLRIQIVDQEGQSMFPSGSAEMYEKTRNLLAQVSKVIAALPNDISVRGHTDAAPYSAGAGYGNWELSADRANSSRRVLVESGLPEKRVNNVLGKADTDHMFGDKPLDARNRRISIILLREELTGKGAGTMNERSAPDRLPPSPVDTPPDLYRQTPGSVQFP